VITTKHYATVLSICVYFYRLGYWCAKIIKFGRDLKKFWQKQVGSSFGTFSSLNFALSGFKRQRNYNNAQSEDFTKPETRRYTTL